MDKYFIFDMDGLLVDSEPYWRQVEKQVFGLVGIDLTDKMCEETVGLRLGDIVGHWYKKYPWLNYSCDDIEQFIIDGMIACYQKDVCAKTGAVSLINRIFETTGDKTAICSSSPLILIETVAENMGIKDKIRLMHSAQNDEFGKPHPLPYLNCAKFLGISPSQAIVFEDSTTGAISAKAASMYVVAVPEGTYSPNKFSFCDQILNSLDEFKIP
jgi:mannitol-1-/sugar-/sorbitol-6-/2-deoxyglucose-6-phosphatase